MARSWQWVCRLRGLAAAAAVVGFCGGTICAAGPPDGAEHPWQVADAMVRASNRGVALMERYEYAAAVAAFEEVVKLAPDSVEARVNLAIALYNRCGKGDLERAEALFDEVIAQEPEHARALYFRGITHQYRGQDEAAAGYFERVVRLVPHDASAWYLLARSKSRLGRPCRSELERAVEENPSLVSAYYDLMRVASLEGKPDEARRHQERFLALRENPLSETVVMPQYRRMGPLATVRPMASAGRPNVAGGELSAGAPQTLLQGLAPGPPRLTKVDAIVVPTVGLAMADVNQDGQLDLAIPASTMRSHGGITLLLRRPDGRFADATQTSGLVIERPTLSCAFGDYDNDGNVDIFAGCRGSNYLFRGHGDGTFEDVTSQTNTAGLNAYSSSAVFLDADHDGDLDIYVCNTIETDSDWHAANQLFNNNGDGTFTDIAPVAGVDCPHAEMLMLAPADIDGDRDTDLAVFSRGAPPRVFFNDRLGRYHESGILGEPVRGDCGGVLQDFNGDGRPDLLTIPGPGTPGGLHLSDGTSLLKPSTQFDECLQTLASWGDTCAARVADVDLDGDLDVVMLADAGHLLLNDGLGRFVVKANVWPEARGGKVIATELADLTGDGVPDLLRVTDADGGTLELVPTVLTPPANWIALTPTGDRGEDKRTRSPVSGYGTRIELRCGLHSQVMFYTGLNGGLCQSHLPLVFGLNGAQEADYVALTWPDGVTQCEIDLAGRTHHRIKEMERRVSSCPVLFAWNGQRFGFVGDFAGVGGLGYFVAPGRYATPQACEYVRIGPGQLQARDGRYELRVCEAMEEVAYVDRLELLAVDHPAEFSVYPDERLAITGPPPTHRLMCPAEPVFPVVAIGPNGEDCADNLLEADRVYAYQPKLDRRFCGFCEPHSLVLDFGDRLTQLEGEQDVYLFVNGWIEYPYSQTTYAASQADVEWEPIKLERPSPGDQWEIVIPDAGAPGGMGRTIALELTGQIGGGECRLRLSTNLEIYYDQAFVAVDRGTEGFTIATAPLVRAELRRLGFPLEYTPDGRHPTIYTYDLIEPTTSFKTPSGAYTRYGRVDELLAEFDDCYVILGSGDEIAVSFDATVLSPPGPGMTRSFVLISHAYCKDMDLYTAEPDTVEPLPFRDMAEYPYAAESAPPDSPCLRDYRERFNTRTVP
jgi:hypothetical protein